MTGRREEPPHLHVREFGHPDGFPILFHHGWPSCGEEASLAHRVATRFRLRLVVPDRPGIGRSSRVSGRRVTDWPATVERIMGDRGIKRFAVLAVSGGTPYALATAAANPAVVSATIISGTPIDSAMRASPGVCPPYRWLHRLVGSRLGAASFLFLLPRALVRGLPTGWLFRPALFALPRPDRLCLRRPGRLDHIAASIREALRPKPRGLVEDGALYFDPWGFDPAIIPCPVAFHHGAEDRNFRPGVVRSLAESIPGATFLEYEDEGHYSLAIRRLPTILRSLRKELPTPDSTRQ